MYLDEMVPSGFISTLGMSEANFWRYQFMHLKNCIRKYTLVFESWNWISSSSMTSRVRRKPSRILLKMVPRQSSFSCFEKPSFVYISRICFRIVDFPLSPAPRILISDASLLSRGKPHVDNRITHRAIRLWQPSSSSFRLFVSPYRFLDYVSYRFWRLPQSMA